MYQGKINLEVAQDALARFEIDELGLDDFDRRLMHTMIRHYGGGPVGLETLAASLGEEAVTIEDVCEPYLMQLGFLARTPKGRVLTQTAYEHLGISPNSCVCNNQQQQLF
jgi:Holliday junction DNA helicase RuvB